MNSFFPILNWAGLLLLKEKLSHCTPYQEAERDSRAQWAAVENHPTAGVVDGGVGFKASHPEALNEEVLDLLDRCNLAAAWERDAAFCLGLQLGLELGGLGRFWDTEP